LLIRQLPAIKLDAQLPPVQTSVVQVSLSSQLAAEQQMPDTQFPLWQSVPSLQVAPSANRVPQVVADPQTVLLGQATAAAHLPVLSQPLTYWLPVQLAGHVSLSGALFTEVQAPTCPLKLQAMQLPVHAVLQQTPSTQVKLDGHFLVELQASPACSGRHPVPMQ
jgi:hypothetical protein